MPLDPDYRDAKKALNVNLRKVKNTTIGNVTTVEIAYTLRNDSPNLIMEDYWKLYCKGEEGKPKYGNHGNFLLGIIVDLFITKGMTEKVNRQKASEMAMLFRS